MNSPQLFASPAVTAERRAYYDRLGRQALAPLWESLSNLVTGSPVSPVQPVAWDYEGVVRPLLVEAGALISAEEAERRVLILENPGLPGQARVNHSLYAGVQMVLPGEIAQAHRHTQSALRFVLESEAGYTTVDGEKTMMSPGDLVLTPNWAWHNHGNEGDSPVIWLDGLDIPLVSFLDASFAEAGNAAEQAETRPPGDSDQRFGANLAPVDWRPTQKSSPLFSYPYARTRESLAALQAGGPADPCHGHKLRYLNPATGGPVMPTISAFVQRLEAGVETAPYRSTDGAVFVVVEGTGHSTIGDKRFAWKPHDVIVAPSWAWQSHRPDGEAVLFSFSDRPVQDVLGLWREERRL